MKRCRGCRHGSIPMERIGSAPAVPLLGAPRRVMGLTRGIALVAVLLGAAPCLGGETTVPAREQRQERMIGPGVKLVTLRREAGPQVIHVVEIERLAGFIRALPVPADDRATGLAPLSAIAERVSTPSAYAIAAINGDFFVQDPGPAQGDPLGVAVLDGEIISTPFPRSALVIDREGRAAVQLLRMEAWVARADGQRHPIHAVNEARGADRLLLYTPRHGASTRANASGTEVTLGDAPLPVRAGTTYTAVVRAVRRRGGDTPIPADGLVLSGHGAAAAFLEGLTPGDTVSFRLEFQPPLPEGAHVLGGGPQLLRGAKEVWQDSIREEKIRESLAFRRHPRTAVGTDGTRLWLVTVDGRQPEHSVGMDLAELAALMRELGCTEALNLDGGGSTTLWVRGAVMNRPSGGRERRIANALVLLSTAPKGPPVRLLLEPEEVFLLAGASLQIRVTGEDEYYNPITLSPDALAWEVAPELGTIDPSGLLTTRKDPDPHLARRSRFVGVPLPQRGAKAPAAGGAETLSPNPPSSVEGGGSNGSYRTGLLRVSYGELRASARVRVYTQPPRLEVVVDGTGTHLPPGATRRFLARASDEAGRPLAIPPGAVVWECDLALGAIDAEGRLTAGQAPARGVVSATVLGLRASLTVTVGTVVCPIDSFEEPRGWSARTFPPGVVGAVESTSERPRSGARALRLRYDFTTGLGNRAVYVVTDREIGAPLALRLWVRGDGGGAWLRARLRDAHGTIHTLDFARRLEKCPDWQECRAVVPAGAVPPLRLEAIYLVETRPEARARGQILFDELAGDYAPR